MIGEVNTKTLGQLAHETYYALTYPEWQSIGPKLGGDQLLATRIIVGVLGPLGAPEKLQFEGLDIFEPVMEMLEDEFEDGFVIRVPIEGQEDVLFFFGRPKSFTFGDGCGKDGVVIKVGGCPYCKATTAFGDHIHNFLDFGQPGSGPPWWHVRPCKVVRADNPEPCH